MHPFVATSIEGFVQQIAVSYVRHGYFFYVTGWIPEGKDPVLVDRKLVERYGVHMSKWARARRKRAGQANMAYIRFGNLFVLMATHGANEFFKEEANVRDVRRAPMKIAGYSIGYRRGADRRWHVSVRIHEDEYRKLKAHFLELAAHRSADAIAAEFARLPFEPYAPVRRQFLNIWRAVNKARGKAGHEPVPVTSLRLFRRIVRPFAEHLVSEAA